MRTGLLAAALTLGLCTVAAAQPATPQTTPLWRVHAEHLAGDRARARACLAASQEAGQEAGRSDCADVIQRPCLGEEDEASSALSRQCDWRAIAAWEDEMNDTLARLRAVLGGRDLANLNASQRAWEASMLADVRLGMDYYAGGSLAGPVGAHFRAIITEQRAVFLSEVRAVEDQH